MCRNGTCCIPYTDARYRDHVNACRRGRLHLPNPLASWCDGKQVSYKVPRGKSLKAFRSGKDTGLIFFALHFVDGSLPYLLSGQSTTLDLATYRNRYGRGMDYCVLSIVLPGTVDPKTQATRLSGLFVNITEMARHSVEERNNATFSRNGRFILRTHYRIWGVRIDCAKACFTDANGVGGVLMNDQAVRAEILSLLDQARHSLY